MSIVINGNGTITGLAVGGLPDGIVDTDMLANNAVATGKIADNAVTSAKSSGLGGLTMVDQWRLSSDSGENNGVIDSYWERCDSYGFGGLGTGMTESSGVFTFPSTGKWWCRINIVGYENELIQQAQVEMRLSTNSGSSYATVAYSVSNTSNDFGGKIYNLSCDSIIDLTNASTFRVRFKGYGARQTEF